MKRILTEEQARVIMTGIRLMQYVRDDLHPTERHIISVLLLFLAEDGYSYVSHKTIRKTSGYTRRTVSSTIKRLVRSEFIAQEPCDNGHRYKLAMHKIIDLDVFLGFKSFKTKPELQGKVPRRLRIRIFVRDRGMCRYCRSCKKLTIDHVKPLSKGGTDAESNLVTACASCNSKKHARTPEQAGMTLLEVPCEQS